MRDGLQRLAALALLGLVSPAFSAAIEVPLPPQLDPRIETLLAPLSGMPSIQRAGEILSVEIEAGAAPDAMAVEAALTPSFGATRPRLSLGMPQKVSASVDSRLWRDRQVDRLEYLLPAELLPDLYDLEVSVAGFGLLSQLSGTDSQRRAVSIVAEYAAAPRVVVLSDTHTGDPREAADMAEDAIQRNEYAQFIEYLQRSIGNPMNSERWALFARAIHEVNLVHPDFVIVTGDLTFLAHPAVLPYEYDDAWRLLDRLEVPAFVAPGNHDLYAVDDYLGANTPAVWDGKDVWQKTFGPLYYSVDIGPRLHLAGLNMFEWPTLDPFPVADQFDTRAAGQMLPEQLAWLENDLRSTRERAPDATLVTFAHHDPSWMQRRHAWMGEGRLESRDLMAKYGVGVHFSGHTHEDRVARYYNGDVVETNGRPHVDGHVVRQLHLLKRDGNLDKALSQEQLGAIVREPANGPLFVSTTTVSSELVGDIWGLGGYFGWRLARLVDRDGKGGLDPADFGYPVTDEFLAQRAERPENWTAEHAQFGLFSYPSFELDREDVSVNEIRVTSRLLADLEIHPVFELGTAGGSDFKAEGGEIEQVRIDGGTARVMVKAVVPAQSSLDVKLYSPDAARERDAADTRFGGPWPWLASVIFVLAALGRRKARF